MAVRDEAFTKGDVYIDFPQEEMLFRFDKASGRVFRRFAGEAAEDEVPRTMELYGEARRYGTETTAAQYFAGLPDR